MTALRTAAQQALEALRKYRRHLNLHGQSDVERALEAALAAPVQEPAGWFEGPFGEFRANQLFKHSWPAQTVAWSIPLYLAPPQRPAEPVQEPDLSRCPKCGGPADNGHDREVPPSPYFCTKCMAEPVPVAWMHVPYPGSGLRQMVSLIQNREPSLYAATVPLYVALPQRKPLTREQAIALWADKSDGPSNGEIVSYCRAVERAHGIS